MDEDRHGAAARTTGLAGPARRIVLASLGVLVLLAVAAGLSIWRYQHAIGLKDSARKAAAESQQAELAGTAFWRVRESANEYLLVGTPDILSEVADQQAAIRPRHPGARTRRRL